MPAKPFAATRIGASCLVLLVLLGLAGRLPVGAQEYPQVEIANGQIRAVLFLPDPEAGYYRGTRFEWGGVFGSLEYGGRNYAARWYEPHDPRRHDSLGGPIQEFVTDGLNNAGLGYAAAQPGETFVKIGVGALRKPDEPGYRFTQYYEIVDPGQWAVAATSDAVEFVQDLSDPGSGYAYRYTKTVRLLPDEPVVVLEHRLLNRGERTIETSVYNHNFLVMDDRPSGPEISVRFPFEVDVTATGARPLLDVRGSRLTYQRPLEAGESVHYRLAGFGGDAADNDFRVESAATGVGIRIAGDRPLSHFVYWSVPSVISPEAYVQMAIEPGGEFEWRTTYTFYEVEASPAR
jgi:hypothetical protein